MTDLAHLIERVEGLSAPSREVDALIAVAVSDDAGAWVVTPSPESVFSHQAGWFCTSDDKSHAAPEYSASIDAAMSLVPEGWSRSTYAIIGKMPSVRMWKDEHDVLVSGNTEALALVAAALKARLSSPTIRQGS